MKIMCIRVVSALAILTTMSLPAWAQQAPGSGGPGPGWGYHHMWGGGWGYGAHPFGPIVMAVVLVLGALLIMRLLRGASFRGCHSAGGASCSRCGRGGNGHAQALLAERFAKGEIGKEEFEEKRRLLRE